MFINESNLPCHESIKAAQLTLRETEVLDQVKQGFSCKEISNRFGIGSETVKTHRKNIITKLGLSGKIEFRKFIFEYLAEENELLNKLLHTHTHIEKTTTHPKITPKGGDFKVSPIYFTHVITTVNKF